MTTSEARRPQNYSSGTMRARRIRILRETRRIITERGVDGVSMAEVSRQADVSKRTLYNVFETRERMIAATIREYFNDYIGRIRYRNPPDTLRNTVERIVGVINRNRQIRHYIRAIMDLYFAQDVGSEIWMAMHAMGTETHLSWLQLLHSRGEILPWIEVEELADDIIRHEYSAISDWAHGRIPDATIVERLLKTYLTFMAGATCGSVCEEIRDLLRAIHEEGLPDSAACGVPVPVAPIGRATSP